MTTTKLQRTSLALAVLLGLSLLAPPLCADDAKSGSATPGADKPVAQEKKRADKAKRAQARGRLPNYYGEVVDETQREKIYAIQQGYKEQFTQLDEQMRELRKQMKSLRDEQAKKVEAIFTAKQLAQVQKLRAQAKEQWAAARKARAEKKQAAKNKPAEAAG